MSSSLARGTEYGVVAVGEGSGLSNRKGGFESRPLCHSFNKAQRTPRVESQLGISRVACSIQELIIWVLRQVVRQCFYTAPRIRSIRIGPTNKVGSRLPTLFPAV